MKERSRRPRECYNQIVRVGPVGGLPWAGFILYWKYMNRPFSHISNMVDLEGLRVLYFDENPINRSVTELVLQERGALCRTVANSWALTEEVAHLSFDVLVFDAHTAVQDMVSFSLALRDPHLRDIKKIAIGNDPSILKTLSVTVQLPAPLDEARLAQELARSRGTVNRTVQSKKTDENKERPLILAVDDSSANRDFIKASLEDAYNIDVAESGEEALERAIREPLPNLILLDVTMGGIDGYETCKHLKNDPRTRSIPVIFLTSLSREEDEERGLSLGAVDYIRKPFSVPILKVRVRNQLELLRYREYLETLVGKRTRELRETQNEVILRLAKAAEYRDSETGSHIKRMGYYAMVLAEALKVSRREADLIFDASPMHDVGKIGIPDHILLKPGKLTAEEWEIMKTHPIIGSQLLGDHPSDILTVAAKIALTHHEKWDGSGYPSGLRGEQIPLEGRIVAICDVFDALLSKRPYKRAWTFDEALDEINRLSNIQFDPVVVRAFNNVFPELAKIREQLTDDTE